MNHFPASVMQNGTADEERQQETEESFWLPPKMKMCESECVRVTVCQRQIQRHKHTHTPLARSMTDFISLLIKSYTASHYDTPSSASADGSTRLFSPSLSASPVFFYPFISISEAEMSSSDMQCSHNFRKSSWSDAGKVEDALNDFEWRNVV